MGYSFSLGAGNQYLHLSVTDFPVGGASSGYTWFCWAKYDTDWQAATVKTALGAGKDTGTTDFVILDGAGSVAGDPYRFLCHAANAAHYSCSEGSWDPSTYEWYPYIGIATDYNTGTLYCPVDQTETNSTSNTSTPTIDHFSIGALRYGGAFTNLMNGSIANVAVWDEPISTQEKDALLAGAHPLLIRPHALWDYFSLDGGSLVGVKGRTLTKSGSPTIVDSPVLGRSRGLQNVGGFSARRRNIINLLTGDQTGAGYWDENKASIPNSAVTRTSETQVTIDLDALDGVIDVSTTETVSLGDLTADMWKP